MRKFIMGLIAGVWLGALLAAPCPANATSYEDSLDDCSYPEVFDVMVLRPLSFVSLVAGTVLYVPLAPIAVATVPGDFDQVTEDMVRTPARFTFQRPLGECSGVTTAY